MVSAWRRVRRARQVRRHLAAELDADHGDSWDVWPCTDCGMPTRPCEQYMVLGDVWASVSHGAEFLCVGCLEDRLGRPLCPVDFAAVPFNDDSELDTVRLRNRKGSGRRVSELQQLGVAAVRLGVPAVEVAERLGLSEALLLNATGGRPA